MNEIYYFDYPGLEFSDSLESYQIPAEEGFLFSGIREDNIERLGEKRTLIVFTTDNTLKHGGIDVNYYMNQYHFKSVLSFPLDMYLTYRIIKLLKPDKNINPPSAMSPILIKLLSNPNKIKLSKDTSMNDAITDILEVCDEYSRSTNTLIVAYLMEAYKYCYTSMRPYPILILNSSMVKSILKKLVSPDSITIKQLIRNYDNFKILDQKIPKNLFIKDMKFDLYHVSPAADIKELTPRITTKPLSKENIGVYRVSAAPSIDACFRAVGIGAVARSAEKVIKYYIYKLKLNKNIRVVKPTNLVPDQYTTQEYWILDPVPVDCIGTITVWVDEETSKLKFDTSDMPFDPLITTEWKVVLNNKNSYSARKEEEPARELNIKNEYKDRKIKPSSSKNRKR